MHPPNPVAGAAAERCPVLADDPADMILDAPASWELGPVIAVGARSRA